MRVCGHAAARALCQLGGAHTRGPLRHLGENARGVLLVEGDRAEGHLDEHLVVGAASALAWAEKGRRELVSGARNASRVVRSGNLPPPTPQCQHRLHGTAVHGERSLRFCKQI